MTSSSSSPYARFQRLGFERPHPRVLRIVLRSPLKLNAMDAQLHTEVSQVWSVVDADPSVSVVIITGEGTAFSAGGDLVHEQKVQDNHALVMQSMQEARNIVLGMANCSKPIVSAIRGWAVGGGLACAFMADISIASRTAKICDGHTKIGLAAGDHAAIIWPLLCGMAKSKYYLLTCDTLSGEEAERIGLVSLAVDDEELDARALAVATRLAEGPQNAIKLTKRALNLWLKHSESIFEASLAYEFLGFSGPESREGIASFVEKRPACFPETATL
ncbi:enoyl-CoA hydratase/isomerase family protein [Hydrogenophaga palleronii]|uniref:enoyl-CoA hydratase/isomerase family protein n=1 Tax=Hydrogenophaga palleronii TaxID=65655 RepID=UPI000825154F|nr:enoyl-CoA hydratase/isomerase family protein [Hydrogenophaga palleronii]